MTTPDPAKRPRQATMAGWMVVIGSAFSVVTAFEVVGRARSLETREAIERFLSESAGSGLGLDVEGMVTILRGTATLAAVIAAMCMVLGVYALRGDRRARLVLAVLAVPLFVTGLALGGFLTSLVAAACALLFVSPTREWYDGKPPPAPPTAPHRAASQNAASRPGPWQSAGPQPPPDDHAEGQGHGPAQHPYGAPYPPFQQGEQQGRQQGEQQGQQQGEKQDEQAAPSPYGPGRPAGMLAPSRPPAVSIAVSLTLVMSSLVLLVSLVGLAAVIAAPDLMVDEMLRSRPDLLEQGMTRQLVVATALTTAVGLVVACLLAIGFAVALLAGKRWGATGLLVMCVLTVVFCMLAALSSLVALVPGVAALLVLTNLRHRDARAWLGR